MAATSSQALQDLQTYQGSLQTPQQAMDAANTALGTTAAQNNVTGLRSAVQNTTNLLGQVAPSVYGRTQNSLVTSAQADKQISNESAPLQSTLSKQGSDLNTAEGDYQNLVGQAQHQADSTLTAQNGRLGTLQSIYEDLYGGEKDAADRAYQQQQLDETKREADLDNQYKQASLKASSSSSDTSGVSSLLASLLGGGNNGSSTNAYISKRSDGGFNFTNSGGQAVSAATYSSLTGQSLADVLHSMGSSGDTTAQNAYNALKASGGTLTPAIKNAYSSIFWGT